MNAHWEQKCVGEILRLEYGKALEAADRITDGSFPVYGANGEIARTDKCYYDKPSIIIGRKGSAGEINFSEGRFWPLDVTYFVTFDNDLYDLRFIYYLLTTLELPKLAKGVKPGINRNDVYSQLTLVPSLPEQHRIVAILDEVFDGIATAKTNAEKNLKNSHAVFDSALNQIFTGLKDCSLRNLEEIVDPDSKITYGVVKPGEEGKVPFVRGGDLVKGSIRIDQLRTITQDVSDQYKRTLLRGGELLICLVGLPGQVAVAPTALAGANIARQVGLIRLFQLANPEFVRFYLQSPIGQKSLLSKQTGSVQQVINLEVLRKVLIPMPDLDQQERVVKKCRLLEQHYQKLVAGFQEKIVLLDGLKKSILHQAFSGAL